MSAGMHVHERAIVNHVGACKFADVEAAHVSMLKMLVAHMQKQKSCMPLQLQLQLSGTTQLCGS